MKLSKDKNYGQDIKYLLFLSFLLIVSIFSYKSADTISNETNSSLSIISIKNAQYHENIYSNGMQDSNLTVNYNISNQNKDNIKITHANTVVKISSDNDRKITNNVYMDPQNKKTFLPHKDFSLIAITLLSYLFIFNALSLYIKRANANKKDRTLNEDIIRVFEDKIDKKDISEERDFKSFIKDLKEIHTFNKDSGYKPTRLNISKLYKIYFLVKDKLVVIEKDNKDKIKKLQEEIKKLEKDNKDKIKKLQEEIKKLEKEIEKIKPLIDILDKKIEKLETHLKDNNKEFEKILNKLVKVENNKFFNYISIFIKFLTFYREEKILQDKIISIFKNKIKNNKDKIFNSHIKNLKEIYTFKRNNGYKSTIKLYEIYCLVKKELTLLKEENKELEKEIQEIIPLLEKKIKKLEEYFKDKNIDIQKVLEQFNEVEKYIQFDVYKTLEIPKVSLEQVLGGYKSLLDFLQNSLESETLVPNKTRLKPSIPGFAKYLFKEKCDEEVYLKKSIELIKKKIDVIDSSSKDKESHQIDNIFSEYDIITYIKRHKNLKNLDISSKKKILDKYNKLLKFIEIKKVTKEKWSKILEIIEERGHHSLLSDFKTYDLRLKPYSIRALTYSFTEIIYEFKIANIYYKIYNTLSSLKDTVSQNMVTKVDNDLIDFVDFKIKEILEHRYDTFLFLLKNSLRNYIFFFIPLLVTLGAISWFIHDFELLILNALFLTNFLIILSVAWVYFSLKKVMQSKFSLSKSKITDYINNIVLVSIAFAVTVILDIGIESGLEKFLSLLNHDKLMSSFFVYEDIAQKIEQLLLPSSFHDIHTLYDLSPIQILIYKILFLLIFGYVIFTMINFLINKYDALYFNKAKKTLVPPELALISINFLLAILILGLLYGTYMHYLDALSYVDSYDDTQTVINGTLSSDSGESDSNYIPFSIFIAVVGGLLTMATKDLLENYFAGISLQMDSPYEEHDRITISDSAMLEVTHIGIRADRFYEIKSNAIRVIPHKKLIDETIVNYTLPTLDYRHELSIYVPHVDKSKNSERSLPKRAEMLLLLSIFVNTGVKIPVLNLDEDGESKTSLGELKTTLGNYWVVVEIVLPLSNNKDDKRGIISKWRELLEKFIEGNIKEENSEEVKKKLKKAKNRLNRLKKELEERNDSTVKEKLDKVGKKLFILRKNMVNNIWDILNSIYDNDDDEVHNPLKRLFIFKLVKAINEAESDQDEKHPEKENDVIFQIKSTVVAILLAVKNFEKDKDALYHHYDKNFVHRKYKMFREPHKKEHKDRIKNMAKELVNINYYYFDLAANLWKLKELQNSLYRKREIDSTSIELLDVPRVTTEHIYSGEGTISYWKVTANLTVELSEQSNEIIHHIHMYLDNLWSDFELPKYYKIENNQKYVDRKNNLENLVVSRRRQAKKSQ